MEPEELDIPIVDKSWAEAFADALWSGSVGSEATTAVLASCGALECADAPGPINGPSQWIWGKQAAYQLGFSTRYTVTGYFIHHAMSIFWATLYEKLNRRSPARTPAKVLALATATSALACIVDYRLVPERLTPGFQKRLSRTSLFFTSGAFALALAASSLITRK
jgi:hypothetical protein